MGRSLAVRPVRIAVALGLVLVGLGAGGAAAGASAGRCGGPGSPVSVGGLGFSGVAATSACNAWVVGGGTLGGNQGTVIEHWNGKAWKVQQQPHWPSGVLYGVAAVSARDAWAVGSSSSVGFVYNQPVAVCQTLIEQWNGTAWVVQQSPSPGILAGNSEENGCGNSGAYLFGVAADSARDAWAVGSYDSSNGTETLVEHWNGTAWEVIPSPNPGGSSSSDQLEAVAAVSPNNVWAVGTSGLFTSAQRPFIEHWNGKSWAVQNSPDPGHSGVLDGVAAVSARDAWAVGDFVNKYGNEQTLVERWNGKAWKKQDSPNLWRNDFLFGVAAVSARDAWAVGYHHTDRANNHTGTLIEHWNGRAWKVQKSANPGRYGYHQLYGVAAVSARDVWAVGYRNYHVVNRPLVERWNGKAWTG